MNASSVIRASNFVEVKIIIHFEVGGEPAEFRCNWFTCRPVIRMRGEEIFLENPLNLSTQFSTKLTKVVKCRIGDHEIAIEQTRPLLFAGIRPTTTESLLTASS